MNTPAPVVLEANARTNRWLRRLAVVVAVLLLIINGTGLGFSIASQVSGTHQRELLVDCVTPGLKTGAVTGHKCWDRLHDPKTTGDAIAVIVDDIYCDQRRAQHHLSSVPDPAIPCRQQTPPDIYPGTSTTLG